MVRSKANPIYRLSTKLRGREVAKAPSIPTHRCYNSCMTGLEIDEIIRSHRKSIALIVKRDGSLVVRAPVRVSQKRILEFVQQQADWVTKQRQKVSLLPPTPATHCFCEGELFYYLGQSYSLHYHNRRKPALELNSHFQLAQAFIPAAHDVFVKWYRQQATRVMTERSELLAKQHGFSFQKINITSARTRWGSCSSRGSINFSWRLVMAPPDVIDYVILHELVHTRAPNHSAVFWRQVEVLMPDFRQKRLWLKQNGHLLTLE